jgi:hypothetical protein
MIEIILLIGMSLLIAILFNAIILSIESIS